MGKAIGIDLGTTNSCAAIIEGGRPRMITYRGGTTIIPSVFAIDEQGRRLVGHDAKRQAQLNPQNTVLGAKRLIGRNFHSKTIEKIRQVFTYEMMEGETSEVLIKVNNQIFTLEQISAAILVAIKEYAEEALEDVVDQAVITVPAYFNDRQRQAVRGAGKLAGLKVLRVLNEPTAAALAYGLGKSLSQRVAVYDLGGGTFDISVIDIKDRIFEVIATGGDTFLGGVDFDGRIMQWALEQFLSEHGIDLSWNRVAIQRIRDASEAAKIELSHVKESRIHIPFITRGPDGPLDVDLTLTREKLDSLTGDLVERTISTCERIFREACTTKDKIDEILLVGGQSRMPLVQRRVAELMGRPPCKGVHPDEAVAIGASIMAHSLSGQRGSDVTLLDVLPMPIGINKVDGTMHVLFARNQPLPDYKTRTLTTSKDNQRSIMLRIYQGDSKLVAENELLGTFVFSGIRAAPKGQVQVEVTFHIDSEGILNLTAKDKATEQVVASTLKLGRTRKEGQDEPEKPVPPPSEPPPSPKAPVARAEPPSKATPDPEGTEEAAPRPKAAPPPLPKLGSPSFSAEAPVEEPTRPEEPRPEEPRPEESKPASEPQAAPEEPSKPEATTGPEEPRPEEPAPGAPAPPTLPAESPSGLLSKVVGWFRGFFGK
jgi:molecular chaperone DnaK